MTMIVIDNISTVTICPICTNVSLYEYEHKEIKDNDDTSPSAISKIVRECYICGYIQDEKRINWDSVIKSWSTSNTNSNNEQEVKK